MAENANRTALVTGANSGLGFEASAQLAEQGYGKLLITTRTIEKGQAAKDALVARTGRDVFETVVLDNDRLQSVTQAAAGLSESGYKIDFVLLNAGVAPAKNLVMSADGLEATYSSTLIGHHLLTMLLLENGGLSSNARIVMAGSEAARGDVPTFHPLDVNAFADEHYAGDLEAAIEAQIRMQPPAKYVPSNTYATTKMFAAWWAAELATFLPEGMTVNTVSPGSTPGTNAARNAPFFMRAFMIPMFKLMPGMSHSVAEGAHRYLEVAEYGDDVTGKFFASPPKKMIGPLEEMRMDHLTNPEGQRALWNVTTKVAGGVGYPAKK